jgi:hypothetical protein
VRAVRSLSGFRCGPTISDDYVANPVQYPEGRPRRCFAELPDGVWHSLGVDNLDVEAARAAWERASRELGIDVQTVGACLNDGHETVEVVALVRDFGSEKGAVFVGSQHRAAYRLAEAQGWFPSMLARSYETYDRELFQDTLNDLQWFGAGDPPAWYTGASWG